MLLTPAQIQQVTKRKRYGAQLRQLALMGIEAKPAADGSPVVLVRTFEAAMGYKSGGNDSGVKLNLDFLGNGS